MIFSNLEHKNCSRMTMLKMEVSLLLTYLSLENQNIPDATLSQGHPVTVFCEMSVRRSNNCLEFSIAWGRLERSRWPFMYNFRSLSIKFLTIFWSLIFPILLPRLSYFFIEKGNLNFRNRECDAERNQKNSHFRITLNYCLRFQENNFEALVILKKDSLAPLRIHF